MPRNLFLYLRRGGGGSSSFFFPSRPPNPTQKRRSYEGNDPLLPSAKSISISILKILRGQFFEVEVERRAALLTCPFSGETGRKNLAGISRCSRLQRTNWPHSTPTPPSNCKREHKQQSGILRSGDPPPLPSFPGARGQEILFFTFCVSWHLFSPVATRVAKE